MELVISFLNQMAKMKGRHNFVDCKWQKIVSPVPRQTNGDDCGVFVCKFGEFVSRRAPIDFSQSNMAFFRRQILLEIIQQKLMISTEQNDILNSLRPSSAMDSSTKKKGNFVIVV